MKAILQTSESRKTNPALEFSKLKKTGFGGVSHILSLGKSAYAVKLFTQHPRTIFVDLILWRMPARYGVGGGMGKINITQLPIKVNRRRRICVDLATLKQAMTY